MSARESVHFEVSRLPEKCLQDIGWPDVQVTQSPFVLDELFDGGSEFPWRPPNPKLETSRSERKRSFAQSAVIGCVRARRYSVRLDSFAVATSASFLRSTLA